jgi:hypothetical protein
MCLGCAGLEQSSVDREDYVAENTALLKAVPAAPSTRLRQTMSAPYFAGDDRGQTLGYTTTRAYSLTRQTSSSMVAAFYRRALAGWHLVDELDGPVLNFCKGDASMSVNLESAGDHGGRMSIVVDHDWYSKEEKLFSGESCPR